MDDTHDHRAPGYADLAAGAVLLVAGTLARTGSGSGAPDLVFVLWSLAAAFLVRSLSLFVIHWYTSLSEVSSPEVDQEP